MSSARHVGLMLGLALLLGACGEVSSPAPDSARAPVVEWGFRQKEFVHMFLPRVARGRRGPMYLEGRALHVLPNGDVIFAGLRYPLATVDEAGYRASLAALGPRIQRQSPLNLNADPFIRWQYVRDVLGLAFEDREGAFLLRWGVTVPAAGGDLCQEADVRLLDAADAGDREHPLAIEVRAREIDGHIVETTLSIGSRAWTMSCDMLTEDPSQSGDLPWAQARAHLAVAAPMPTRAVLRTSDTKAVTWGHVAECLDLILGAGIREVDVPDLGVHLALAEPDDLSRDPFKTEDDPVVTPLAVVVSLVLIALAFLATYGGVAHAGPSRRRRRSERTAARTKARPPT